MYILTFVLNINLRDLTEQMAEWTWEQVCMSAACVYLSVWVKLIAKLFLGKI